jgi:FixJ family two-component response regulator
MDFTGTLQRASERGLADIRLPRVHVVDDDDMVRNALARLLRDRGFLVLAFDSAESFLDRWEPDAPGCLILDIALPELSGLGLQEHLDQRDDQLPVIFLTGQADVAMCAQAMKRGAIDFLLKPIDETDLTNAVARALECNARHRLFRHQRDHTQSMLATLTPREREVLAHVMEGRLNKQIAADLGTAEKTVKVHRAHAMEKMHVRSVAALVRMIERANGADPAHHD